MSELSTQFPKKNSVNSGKLIIILSEPSCKEYLHTEPHDRLVISCALDCAAANIEHIDFAHAVLGSVQPSINKSEITDIRSLIGVSAARTALRPGKSEAVRRCLYPAS